MRALHRPLPGGAWPEAVRGLIPGPILYWACTLGTALALVAALLVAYRVFAGPGPGTDRRRRLGVDTRAHWPDPVTSLPSWFPAPALVVS